MTTRMQVPSHETRLALVMNGGVSLAVWMGGVTHELDILRRASSGESVDSVDQREREVFEIWKQLARKAGTKVVIDIVSGTSAGGINGLMLATTIARGGPLPSLRSLWRESAALEKLLQPPSRTSVLNGGTFENQVQDAVQRIGGSVDGSKHPVTLFVTATALDGRSRSYQDGFGTQFQVRDHRRLYRFQMDKHVVYHKRDSGEWEFQESILSHFGDNHLPALVQAARATAGYPVAFPPVSEYPLMPYRIQPEPELDFPASCVIDGGVLNNAPFGPVLETITGREVDNPVRRVVIYVVPSVGRLAEESTKDQSCEGIQWDSAAVNAIRYPQEVNLRSGTEDLDARLGASVRDRQLELYQRLHEGAKKEKGNGKGELFEHLHEAAGKLINEYRRNRTAALLYDIRKRISEGIPTSSLVVTSEWDSVRIDNILGARGRHLDPKWRHPSWIPRYNEPIDFDLAKEWHWGIIAAERVIQCLSGHLLELLDTPDAKDEAVEHALVGGGRKVSDCLRRVLAMVNSLHSEVRINADKNDLAEEGIARLYETVFTRLGLPARLQELVNTASNSYTNALVEAGFNNSWTTEDVVTACLTVEVLTRAYAPPSKVVEKLPPKFEFMRLGPDTMSPLFREDQFDGFGDRKLYGFRLSHFGAFVDENWRQSDFTWGRLDAAHHLLYLLGGTSEQERRQEEELLHRAILVAEAPTDGERPTESRARTWMEQHLEHLKKPDGQLLKEQLDTPAGNHTLREVGNAVLTLLSNAGDPDDPGIPSRPTPGWLKIWRRTVEYGRSTFARPQDLRGKDAKLWQRRQQTWVRRVPTYYIRRAAWKAYDDDLRKVPRAVITAAKRTAAAGIFAAFAAGAAAGRIRLATRTMAQVKVWLRWVTTGKR